MSTIKIATRYAKALLDQAIEANELEQVFEDVKSVRSSIAGSRELELFLKSPIIKSDKKGAILKEVFSGKISPLVLEFINVLVSKKREGLLDDVTSAFEDAYNQLKGVTKLQLTTAVAISPEIESQLLSKVKSQFKLTNMDVTKVVDADIIGGFVVRFMDKIYDNSVAHRINTVERSIIS